MKKLFADTPVLNSGKRHEGAQRLVYKTLVLNAYDRIKGNAQEKEKDELAARRATIRERARRAL
jgi:hypothetical protein